MRDPVRFRYRPDGRADDWEIAGWVSVPPGAGDTLLILVHGGFYTHAYWDFPYRPETYSCVLWAWERGLATLNIDRPGNGESTHPPGLDLDMPRNAEALHEVIKAVRPDGVGGHRFSKMVTVGHSLGSFTAALAQADHGGASLLGSGWSHKWSGIPGSQSPDCDPARCIRRLLVDQKGREATIRSAFNGVPAVPAKPQLPRR